MIALLWASFAAATPEAPFPRSEERIRVRRYAEVRGDGPVTAHYRRSAGPIQAWTWPDGTIEHYELLERGRVVERHHFTVTGAPLASVLFAEDGSPASVRALDTDIDVAGWTTATVAGGSLRVPGAPTTEEGATTWSGDQWQVRVVPFAEAADPFSDAFRDAFAESCGCVLLDRTTAWLDERPAVRYQLSVPDPDHPLEGELWAVRSGEQTWLIASTGRDRARLATGRAIVALLEWQ